MAAGTGSKKFDPTAELAKEIAALERTIGKDMIRPASAQPPVYHLPFCSPHMNYVTEGGAPWNRVVALFGDESTGKSFCALELVAQAQQLPLSAEKVLMPRIKHHREDGNVIYVERLEHELEWIRENFPDGARCLWHDVEGQFDVKRAAQVGIDLDALYMSELNVIEDIGTSLPFGYKNFHLQVIDSTTAATSQLSLKQEAGKSLVGTDARQWKAVVRNSMTFFGPQKNTSGYSNMLVLIHQMSTNVKSGASQAASTKYLRHTSSCTIKFIRGKFLWNVGGVLDDTKATGADDAAMAGMAEPDGAEIFVKVEKSRTSRPFRVGAMHFDYKTLGYVSVAELAASGLYHGLIIKSGNWYKVDGEEKACGQGMKAVHARLAEDPELCDKIYARLMDFSRE